MIQAEPGAVKPHEEGGLGLDGRDARDVLAAIVHHHIDVALNVLQALGKPLAAMTIGSARSGHREEVGRALLIAFQTVEEWFPQVGILDHAPRAHDAGNIERLAGSAHHHAHGAGIIAHGKK